MNTPEWLNAALANPDITDVCLNGAERAYMDRGHGLEPLENLGGFQSWSDDEMRGWVLEQLAAVGKSWDARHPFIDATLASNHRIHVAFPPLARSGILVSLRRLPEPPLRGPDRSNPRWARSASGAWYFGRLAAVVERGESILISGATGSGKTTLATDLLSLVPAHERIIALEDTPELNPAHPHYLSLISRPPNADGYGEVTLRTLLKQALRMRPDRIVLGECRGPEVMDLLQALNTGHRGLIATLHSNSPRDALRRVELLCLLSSSGNVSSGALRELLAVGIQWVAQVRRKGREREIAELARIEGREGDAILMRPVLPDLGIKTDSQRFQDMR